MTALGLNQLVSKEGTYRILSLCRRVRQGAVLVAVLACGWPQAEAKVPMAIGNQKACLASLASGQIPQSFLNSYRVDSGSRTQILLEILETREPQVLKDLQINRRFVQCLEGDPSGRNCPEAMSYLGRIRSRAQMARLSLGAAQSQYEWSTWASRADQKPNSNLSALGSFKLRAWQPLSKAELDIVNQALQTIEADLKTQSASESEAARRTREESLISQRMAYFIDYATIMSTTPLLQWIETANPSVLEFVKALKEASRWSERDLASIEMQREGIELYSRMSEMKPQINAPIQYTEIVRHFAERDTETCLVLLKLKAEFRDVQSQDQIGMVVAGVPFLFLSGPLGLVAVTGLSAGYMGSAQWQLSGVESRELGLSLIDWSSVDLGALRSVSRDRNATAVSVVIGLPVLRGGQVVFRASSTLFSKLVKNRNLLLALAARRIQ